MDTARWARVRALLESALDLDAPRRAELLASACGDDAELRAEVESLLAADAAGSGLEPPRRAELARAVEDPGLGRRVGPYVLERVLGSGGMGVVYLARRAGEDFEQHVALKLIKRGMDTDEILRQFRRERALLAGLEHPGIARLLDGGATEDGLPWFAMELVEGRPIGAWCDEHGLATRARVELFVAVCAAVRHAHQRLIVHRDLKPSNILVGRDGVPRLLDFGIARVVAPESEGADAGSTQTLAAERRLTPDYASPEQLRGDRVTTATDVYSLGVILYELLTGSNPFHGSDPATRREPERPSTRVALEGTRNPRAPARRRRELRGDLDTIVMTALAPDVRRRYASVEALELDLRRHLASLPIEARPATALYRARKLLRRNRLAVAAAGAVFAALLVGLALAWRGHAEALEQRGLAEARQRRAEQATDRANSVLALTRRMLGGASPHDVLSKDITLRQLLDEFDAELDVHGSVDPEVEAAVRATLARAYRELGLFDQAQKHLDRALRLQPDARLDESEVALELARTGLSLLHDRGEYARAISEANALLARLPATGPAAAARSRVITLRGDCHRHRNEFGAAEQDLREALALLRAEEALPDGARAAAGSASARVRDDGSVEARGAPDDLLHCMSVLASTLEHTRALEEARTLAEEALAIARARTGELSVRTSVALNGLGHVLMQQGELAASEDALRASLAIERKLHPEGHPQVAPVLTNLGSVLRQRGDFAGAEPFLREAVALSRRIHGEKHALVATELSTLGALLQSMGDLAGAEAAMRETLEIRRAAYGEEHVLVARSLHNLGVVLRNLDQGEEAEAALRQALALRRKLLGARDVAVAATLANLAGLLPARGKLEEAEQAAREAVSIHREALGPAHSDLASSITALAGVLKRQGALDEARGLVEEALAMRRRLFGAQHPDVARSSCQLGEILLALGALEDARPRLDEALAVQRAMLAGTHPDLARTVRAQCELAEREGRGSDALELGREVLAICRASLGDAHADTRAAARRLVDLLAASGDEEGASRLSAELALPSAGLEAPGGR